MSLFSVAICHGGMEQKYPLPFSFSPLLKEHQSVLKQKDWLSKLLHLRHLTELEGPETD